MELSIHREIGRDAIVFSLLSFLIRARSVFAIFFAYLREQSNKHLLILIILAILRTLYLNSARSLFVFVSRDIEVVGVARASIEHIVTYTSLLINS